jgi:tetratricopeptide (TPR) repeat protein
MNMFTTRRRTATSASLAARRLLLVALLGLNTATARAQTEAPSPHPWYVGVSEERQQKARALFREGRELHRQLMLGEARAKYEEALTHWDHPQLRLYLGRVLVRIGLPLLAYENLQKALQWGPGALDQEDEKEARAELRALTQKELASLKIRCDEPGAAVMLDGKPWFRGPGFERRAVTPGEHIITAKKVGYYTVVKPVVVLAGKEASGEAKLSVDRTLTERLWPAWQPWAVVGAGAAVSLLGVGLQLQANKDRDEAERKLQTICGGSCAPSSAGGYDRSQLENRVAIGSLIVGGAVLVTGAVMVVMNLPRSRRTKDDGDVKIGVVSF